MATETLSLNDYADAREDVVIFFAGVGHPTGDYCLADCPDDDFADRRGLFDLTGTVDVDGDWRWDGEGNPTDDRGNTIYKVHAYVDAAKWSELASDGE